MEDRICQLLFLFVCYSFQLAQLFPIKQSTKASIASITATGRKEESNLSVLKSFISFLIIRLNYLPEDFIVGTAIWWNLKISDLFG